MSNFDIAISGGRIIDPDSGLDSITNIGIKKGIIAEISNATLDAEETIDATGKVVSPGFIDTDMTMNIAEKVKMFLTSRIPMGKLGKGEDVSDCVAFLSSDAASYITGETIHVNGGMYMP